MWKWKKLESLSDNDANAWEVYPFKINEKIESNFLVHDDLLFFYSITLERCKICRYFCRVSNRFWKDATISDSKS